MSKTITLNRLWVGNYFITVFFGAVGLLPMTINNGLQGFWDDIVSALYLIGFCTMLRSIEKKMGASKGRLPILPGGALIWFVCLSPFTTYYHPISYVIFNIFFSVIFVISLHRYE